MSRQYKLKTNCQEKQYGAIYIVNKEKVQSDWYGIIITSKRDDYSDELVHVCRVNLKEDNTLEICPEEKGKLEWDWIVANYIYFATAPRTLMAELKSYL